MTEWDKLYRRLLEKQKVEGYLKEEVRNVGRRKKGQTPSVCLFHISVLKDALGAVRSKGD